MIGKFVRTNLAISHFTALIAAFFLIQLSAAASAEDASLSPQKLLFDKPYLTNLAVPSSLHYTYQHATSEEKLYGKPFQDTIAVNIGTNDNAGGINSIMLRVFTGKRQRDLGPHLDMKGNPIIMVFLERDLWQMKRHVGGTATFYRNKIRQAFRDAAEVEESQAEFGGETITVHKVTITPFAAEKNDQRIGKFLNKSYEFTVADAVPGGVLSMRSTVPADGATLIEDELTFVKAQ